MLNGYDAVGIPTNGLVNKWGELVMGAGVARQARDRWQPWLGEHMGAAVARYGNNVHLFENIVDDNPCPRFIFSFPTKHKPRDRMGDLALVRRSSLQLMAIIKAKGFTKVLMPEPGTGLGKLSFNDVAKVLNSICDSRVHIAQLPPAEEAVFDMEDDDAA